MRSKRWAAVSLALVLCIAETSPTMAMENAGLSLQTDTADTAKLQTENIYDEADTEAADPALVIPESFEAETEILAPEPSETAEEELTIDFVEVVDDPAGEPSNTLELWDTAAAADSGQTELSLDAEHFPDKAFRSYLNKFDKDASGGLSPNEIDDVTEIDVIGKGICDLTGLAFFPELTDLYCDNNQLTKLDVSHNLYLECLTCSYNQLSSLNLQNNSSLFSLVCSNNQIASLDLSKHTQLQDLRCAGNQLQMLDLSHNPSLTWLDCSRNKLITLDVSKHKSLYYLFCNDNQLSSLNIAGTTKLQWLECQQNQLTELDVSNALNVSDVDDSAMNLLNCADNQLTSLDVSNKRYFKGLICSNNALTALDLSTNTDLRQLECANNALTSLNVTKNKKLQTLDCSGNRLTSLNLSTLSITETTVLPNCADQELLIPLIQTENSYQVDLSPFIGDSNFLRLTQEELQSDLCTEKSVLGNLILLTQEGELENGILTFPAGQVPETIELIYATGYRKKAGEKDVLLEIHLHCHTHKFEHFEKAATCTEDGYSEEMCAECGAVLEKEVFQALGHVYQQTKTDPTCTTDGILQKKCTVCGEKTEIISQALGHDYQQVKVIAPSCTTAGLVLEQCSRCETLKETVLPATGHTYGAYTVVRAATVFKAGEQERSCSVCGSVQSETIPKLSGTINLKADSLPVQINEKVTVQSLVTGLQAGDYVTSWTSANPKIAAISADGTILAKKTGTAKITVSTKSGATAIMAVHVQVDEVATTNISGLKKKLSLTAGKKLRLTPVLTPISSQQTITYKSSNQKVAKVSARGVVKGLRKGTAKITVKSGSKKYVVRLKVTPAVKKIKRVPAEKTLAKGMTFQLKPKLKPAGCSQKITYKSSNKKIASVSAKGKITARKEGTARITVTAGNVKVVCKVTVTDSLSG